MTAIEEHIAKALRLHRQCDYFGEPVDECDCGYPRTPEDYQLADWQAHVAKVLVAELGLTQEWCARHESGGGFGGWGNAEDARRFLAESVERPPSVDDPGSGRYIGLESRSVTAWEAE